MMRRKGKLKILFRKVRSFCKSFVFLEPNFESKPNQKKMPKILLYQYISLHIQQTNKTDKNRPKQNRTEQNKQKTKTKRGVIGTYPNTGE